MFLRYTRGDGCFIQANGRTVFAWALCLFKREDEAKEHAAKCTKSLIYARLNELGSYFSSLKELGENFLNEEILRDVKAKIVKDFYSEKDKKQL